MTPSQLGWLPGTSEVLDWVEEGERLLAERIATLHDSAVGEPSRLPGWTRGHVLTHLARNCDALVNLCTWARTGTRTPMYPSADVRNADIEAGATRPIAEQRADLAAAVERFLETARGLRPDEWAAMVQSAQGRDISAAEIPWMRARETWIHLCDLDIGYGFEILPDAVARALVQDVAGYMDSRIDRRVQLPDAFDGRAFGGSAESAAVRVRGTAQALAAWLVGRSRGESLEVEGGQAVPELPRWL